jgi:thioredoxin-related protein
MINKIGRALLATAALATTVWAGENAWVTDLSKAEEQAQQENKLVLMDFTGSDWCPPCKLLHKNVLTSKEFLEYAKSNLVLVLVDFPISKPLPPDPEKANKTLARHYQVEAYPTIVITDAKGKVLSLTAGYENESARAFVDRLRKIKRPG